MSRGRMIIETDSGRNTKSFERRLSVNGRGRWKVEFPRPLSSRYIDFPCIPSNARANSKILLWEGGGGVGVNCSSNGTAISFPQLRTRLLAGRLSRVRIYNGDILVKTRVQKIQLLRDYRSFFSLQTGKKEWRKGKSRQVFESRATKIHSSNETFRNENQKKSKERVSLWITFPTGCPFLFVSSKRKKKKRKGEPLDFQFLPPPLPPFDKIAQRARKLADQVDDRFAVSPYSSFTLDKSVSNNSKKRKRNEWKTTRRRFPSRVV